MSFLDYISGKETEPNKSVLEEDGNKQTYELNSQGNLVPVGSESPLPEIGGLLGGVGAALITKNPEAGIAARGAIPTLIRTLVPSLAGSTAGTAVGLGAEGLLSGEMTPGRVGGALLENAAWDVGGNLVFSALGKTYRLGKEALQSAGITKAGTFGDAQLAAQKFLSERNATLTRGQLTGSAKDTFLEGLAGGGTGFDIFKTQQEGVKEAINKGVQEVKSTLQTSDAFQQALKADEPLSRAAGENFQNLINTARTEFKDKYRPFYDSLSKDYGVYVDMRSLKSQAEAEMERLARTKFAGAGAARKEVLDDILKQNDFIEFGAAHDLRSAFSGAANDLKIPGAGTTSKGAAYSKYANEVEKQMDSAMQITGPSKARMEKAGVQGNITPATSTEAITTGATGFNPYTQRTALSKDMVQQYAENQRAYKQGMQGLYNETINEGMKQSPSKVGAYTFDLAETEKATDLFNAVSQVDKYAKQAGKDGGQLFNDFKYGFLEQALSTPEKVAKFSSTLEQDPEMRRAFYKMFKNESAPLKDVLNAAKVGLENQANEGVYLRNKALIAGGQVLGAAATYAALPQDVKDKVNLPEAAITAGLFIVTPRMIAKAATNKEAISALADMTKLQSQNKFAGAAAVKVIDRLNTSGIIDSQYVTDVENFFGQKQQPIQQEQPTQQQDSFLNYLNQ